MKAFRLSIMLALSLLALILASASINEVELGADGDIRMDGDVSSDITDSFLISLSNQLQTGVSIYWYDNLKDEEQGFHMLDLRPGQKGSINTFHGHSFFAISKKDGSGNGAPTAVVTNSIHKFTVQFSKTEYDISLNSEAQEKAFQPVRAKQAVSTRPLNSDEDPAKRRLNIEVRNRHHPNVLSMANERIDSSVMMNAKFRSLSPRKVDLWYDDGKTGTPQGTLSTGQESTTNTFVGHVFYVTLHGNKSTEITRFTMEKGRVLYVIYDTKEYPPPDDLLERTHTEVDFMENYLSTYGIRWRHYYGNSFVAHLHSPMNYFP